MKNFDYLNNNPDAITLLESYQNLHNFYQFLYKNLNKITLDNDTENKKSFNEISEVIGSVPFLLNAQIPILFDDFLCYPIFYRHRHIIYSSKEKKYTTHYYDFLEKYHSRYETFVKHFQLFFSYFEQKKHSINEFEDSSNFFNNQFNEQLISDLDKLKNYSIHPPFDLNHYILENNQNYIQYLANNSTLSTPKIANNSNSLSHQI